MKTIKISNHRSSPLFFLIAGERRNTSMGGTPKKHGCIYLLFGVHLDTAEQPAEAMTHMQKCSLLSFLHQFSKLGAAKHAGVYVLLFESKPYVRRVLDYFYHRTEGCSKVIGFGVP